MRSGLRYHTVWYVIRPGQARVPSGGVPRGLVAPGVSEEWVQEAKGFGASVPVNGGSRCCAPTKTSWNTRAMRRTQPPPSPCARSAAPRGTGACARPPGPEPRVRGAPGATRPGSRARGSGRPPPMPMGQPSQPLLHRGLRHDAGDQAVGGAALPFPEQGVDVALTPLEVMVERALGAAEALAERVHREGSVSLRREDAESLLDPVVSGERFRSVPRAGDSNTIPYSMLGPRSSFDLSRHKLGPGSFPLTQATGTSGRTIFQAWTSMRSTTRSFRRSTGIASGSSAIRTRRRTWPRRPSRLLDRQVTGEQAALRVWLFKVATHLIRDRWRVTQPPAPAARSTR